MRLYELLKEMYDEDDFNKVFGICPTCKQKKSKCQCELDEGSYGYGAEGKPEWFDRAVALKKANPRITAVEIARQLGIPQSQVLYWLTGVGGSVRMRKRPKDSFPFEPGAFPQGAGNLKYTDGAKPDWYDQALQMAKAGGTFIAISKKLGVSPDNIGKWLIKGRKSRYGKIINPDAVLEPRKIRGKKLDVNLLMDFISTGYTDEDIIELIVDEKGPKIASQVKNMLPILRKKLNPGTQVIDKTATGINNPDISSVVPESRENLDEDIGDDQYPDITQSKKEEIIHAWEYQEDLIDIGNGYQILSGENHGRADNVALLIGPDYKIKDEDTDIEKLLDNNFGIIQGENFADGKKEAFIRPNFDYEWEEANRYPEFKKLGKDGWVELASKGKATTIVSAKDINNTDAADVDSFKTLDPQKQKRATAQLKSGKVEMPIVAVYSDGHKELIGGNTRLTAMMHDKGQATVWQFEVPDEILDENFADGKVKGKSRPGRVKKSGASCDGSVTSLRKKAKDSSGEKSKMYHWCANMKSGKKKK